MTEFTYLMQHNVGIDHKPMAGFTRKLRMTTSSFDR